MSHGSVYRHFASKAALRDAVTERWLAAISAPLAVVADEERPAPERLRRWLDLLVSSKRSKALDDPELFATYIELTADARDVVKAHVDTLVAQLARIIADGVARGAVREGDRPSGVRRAPCSTRPSASTIQRTPPPGVTPASTPPTKPSERSSWVGSNESSRVAAPDLSRRPEPALRPVGCVNSISLHSGRFSRRDEFVHPTGFRQPVTHARGTSRLSRARDRELGRRDSPGSKVLSEGTP